MNVVVVNGREYPVCPSCKDKMYPSKIEGWNTKYICRSCNEVLER